ncbi:WES_acyltransf domain-containing protein/DUF1298 domain-containing protein [Cephalotus follicularis]|uniref:WES_acyltransf domain-containing protein/DUF1298 domain-containing protein n=1 Tax=Cephalotus follicularis TaxID=3775 RepID=A0A1Q3CK04_CEPFO|nr:WES_acyltransf domain-containing protein/DUF1298 domain-containing protein [Cephalotus follicularis]
MEFKENEGSQPVSPTGQYFTSTVLSISILAVLEFKIPLHALSTMLLLKNVFLPINPRFSSIMVRGKKGEKQWKRVEVKLENHVNHPIFPAGLTPDSYEQYLTDYLSRIALERFPQSQPLWEVHIIKYPTINAAGSVIFKLHHALGDGYSLMGALLSCLHRADDPSLSLTFPSLRLLSKTGEENKRIVKRVQKRFSWVINTVRDFGWGLLKSSLVEDDRTLIRSGDAGVEFKPITITTITFSLDHIKQIKYKLGVTINDVITGTIFFGTRLYMQTASQKLKDEHTTALVLLNTRDIDGYKSVKEMVNPDADSLWGNKFAFLHVSLPKLIDAEFTNPLKFILKARKNIKRKRSSLAVILTGRLLEALKSYRSPEVAARYIHSTLKNSSMTISNVIGPVEEMALDNHPIKGLYFMVVGVPQNLTISVLSYMGKLRVAVGTEKGFIDPQKFKACIEIAYQKMLKAASEIP